MIRFVLLASLVLSTACGAEGLSVQGGVTLDPAGVAARTGFDFGLETDLAPDNMAAAVFSGHCVLSDNGAASFGLSRPTGSNDPTDVVGLRQVNIEFPDASSDEPAFVQAAVVQAAVGEARWSADASAGCSVLLEDQSTKSRFAHVFVDCTITDGADSGALSADLFFYGCDVQ